MEPNERISNFFGLQESSELKQLILQFCDDPQTKGSLPFVDINLQEKALIKIKEEICRYPFDVTLTGEIEFSKTIVGFRDYRRYIFKIDIQNSFNQQINQYLPQISTIELTLSKQSTFCFYFICNTEDLFVFSQAFSDWLSDVDLPLTD